MSDRYSGQHPAFNFGSSGAFGSEPQPKPKHNPLEDFLRLAGGVAPAVGAVGGGLLGTFAAPGLGTAAGAGLGAALGSGLGGAATWGADELARPQAEQEDARMKREQERQARAQAAMSILGGL